MNSAILKVQRVLDKSNVVHSNRKFIVVYMGNPMTLRTGKNVWSGRNHAATAVTNFVRGIVGYSELKNCGYESFGEITKDLIKQGIISIVEVEFKEI